MTNTVARLAQARALGLRLGGVGSTGAVVVPRAVANSFAVANRSDEIVAIAVAVVASILAGNVGRVSRIRGTRSVNRREISACTVGPVNGGSPTSISYKTQPNE